MKGIWDFTGLIFIIYQSVIIPYRLCFEVDAEGSWNVMETIIDITFIIDIFVSFNTGFYKKGYLVMKRKEITKNYLKTWFVLDLLASFPYEWVIPT